MSKRRSTRISASSSPLQATAGGDPTAGRRLKVLFLASWYPSKEHPVSGIFVKRHALAVSNYCDVAVVYVNMGTVDEGIDVSRDRGLTEVRVYRRLREYRHPWMRALYRFFIFYIDYLMAGYQGYLAAKREFGTPDLAHVNVIAYAGIIGLALKYLRGIQYVVTEHSVEYMEMDGSFFRHTFLGRSLILAVARNAKAIMAVSAGLKDSMIGCGLKSKYYVVPNVVELEYDARAACSGTKKRIIHISLLKDRQKNVSGLLEALEELTKRRDDFELHIIGDGIDRSDLEAKAARSGLLNKSVFFHGRVSDEELTGSLSSSDFAVINSNFETFCIAAAEPLASGKPVIATKCGGPEEFVDERCGILINPGDKAALVEALDYMLDHCSEFNPEEIRKKAKSLFSPKIVGKMIYDIYKDVLGWKD